MRFLNLMLLLTLGFTLCACADLGQPKETRSVAHDSQLQVVSVDENQKTLMTLREPSVLLGGSEGNRRCLVSFPLDLDSAFGESEDPIVSLTVEGGNRCGIFSTPDQDEILESASFPDRLDADLSSVRIGCLADLSESDYSKLINGNGPQHRLLEGLASSSMDGLEVVGTTASGQERRCRLLQNN